MGQIIKYDGADRNLSVQQFLPVDKSIPCPRCGGHLGEMLSDGYLPCYFCGDSGKHKITLWPLFEYDVYVAMIDGCIHACPVSEFGMPVITSGYYKDQSPIERLNPVWAYPFFDYDNGVNCQSTIEATDEFVVAACRVMGEHDYLEKHFPRLAFP